MHRTPSPPRRVHTPPAPLHGDAHELFSPRRSSRVAAQRDHLHHSGQQQTSPRVRRDITPTASSKRSAARASHFALSPPSSPISPQQLRSPRSTRRTRVDLNPLDSDSDHLAPTPARRFLSSMPSVCPRSFESSLEPLLIVRPGHATHAFKNSPEAPHRRHELHCARSLPKSPRHD